MEPTTEDRPRQLAARLAQTLSLAGISARRLDTLAGQTVGHFSLMVDRLRSRPNADIETETATAYAAVLGVDLNWLLTGDGEEPTEESVRAAVEAARARKAA
jgi:enoyl-[acyl-carrier-protein] reductase (NADH)